MSGKLFIAIFLFIGFCAVNGAAQIDLIGTGLEVTQGTQSLDNSVRLAAGKTTYVRFYARSVGGNAVTTAKLTVTKGGNSVVLTPINPGGEVNVLAEPDRKILNQIFTFMLPEAYTTVGTIGLLAEVNPAPRNVEETNTANNFWEITSGSLQFETVPTLDLVIYSIGYTIDGTEYYPRDVEREQVVDWIKKAWAVNNVTFKFRKESIRETLGEDRLPTCREVNNFMLTKRTADLQTPGSEITASTRYYGMVSDEGGFMRGCANGLPGFASSGPTGKPRTNPDAFLGSWDTDGSFGDWYGAHEIAHNLNRRHAEFCGARGGVAFPNPDGSISPTTTGPNTVFGTDLITGAIYPTNWTENMAYCARQWTSDFTVNGIMTFMQQNFGNEGGAASLRPPQDSFLVQGSILPSPGPVTANIQPLFFLDEATDVTNPIPGNYAIVLRNAANTQLLRHPFTPDEVAEEDTETTQFPNDELAINELVPFVSGATRVEIEAPGGQVIGSINAGANNPIVTAVTAGTITPGQPVNLSWTALDLDGDPLTFIVQYSDDNGASWRVASSYLRGARIGGGPLFSTTIDPLDLTAGTQSRFRVLASDGIHTGTADSGTFSVANNPPTAAIEAPGDDTTITLNEPITFRADAYDIDEGQPPTNEMTWTSSINGTLGNGNELTVSNLSLGEHTITFTVNDGSGGVVTDTITVEVTNERVRKSVNDYDGDGETDVAVFRPSNGTWYLAGSDDADVRTIQWGVNGDLPVQADYDNDGSVDLAVFRPSNGTWYIRESGRGTIRYERWGLSGDIPAAADYDGDAKIDIAVFRPSNGIWYIKQSSDNQVLFVNWGLNGDTPVPADYDGDTLTDLAVFRPSNNVWYILQSSNGGFRIQQFGVAGDVPTVEDYDNDGEADISIFRPSTGFWWTQQSSSPSFLLARRWGANGDKPVAGDYDGDGIGDLVVFRPGDGIWYVLQSSNGTVRYIRFGLSTDTPV